MHSLYVAPSPGRRCKVTFPRLWKGTMSINAVADVDVHQMPLPDAMTPAQERPSVAIELSPDDLEQSLPVPVETDTEDLAYSGVGSGNGKSPSQAPALNAHPTLRHASRAHESRWWGCPRFQQVGERLARKAD